MVHDDVLGREQHRVQQGLASQRVEVRDRIGTGIGTDSTGRALALGPSPRDKCPACHGRIG